MWDNFANILRKLGEKSLPKIGCYVLLLARENLRLKNSYILAKTWLSAPKITRPNKLQHYFSIIINIFLYHGHKNKQKTKNINSLAHIRDLNLPPIRFVQFVPRFVSIRHGRHVLSQCPKQRHSPPGNIKKWY